MTTDTFTAEAREAGQKARIVAHDAQKLLQNAMERGFRPGPRQQEQVLSRLEKMPPTARTTYLRAMKGGSRQTGIKAFCQMCFGWDHPRAEIPQCTDLACPLYPYRPYREPVSG